MEEGRGEDLCCGVVAAWSRRRCKEIDRCHQSLFEFLSYLLALSCALRRAVNINIYKKRLEDKYDKGEEREGGREGGREEERKARGEEGKRSRRR